MQDYSNWPTYPQLYVNQELLGGCDIILELHASHQLRESIDEALGGMEPGNGEPPLHARLKQLVNSHTVMLFMKVSEACIPLVCSNAASLSSTQTEHLYSSMINLQIQLCFAVNAHMHVLALGWID